MGLKQKKVSIDGEEYELTQLGAIQGRRLWLRVLQALSPALKELAAAGKLDEGSVAQAFGTLVEGLDDETVEMFCAAFAARTRVCVDGDKWPELEPARFDLHFAGRYISMTKWLGECLLFNFADYFDGASREMLAGMVREAGAKSPFRKGSTGRSGASRPTSVPQ